MSPKRSNLSSSNDSSNDSPLHLWKGGRSEVDLNCDMGEGIDTDELIMPFISSANIACGYHAGDENSIWETISLANKHNVAVGAHVSFFDKENFGRSEMKLPAKEVYDLITQQLIIIKEVADSLDTVLHHVKPHGALYNMSARDAALAKTIAQAIMDFDSSLVLYGLSNSHSVDEAKKIGLKTANEVFADRTYNDDGSLTPRSQPNALIENNEKAIQQVLQMIKEGAVVATSGKRISMTAETVCIHGDGKNAVVFVKSISEALKKEGIKIRSLA